MGWRVVPPRSTLLRGKGPARPPAAAPGAARLEAWAKTLAVLFSSLYVAGLVATNMYLLGLGISDFTLLQARCIVTGALFCTYLAVLWAVAWLVAWVVTEALSSVYIKRSASALDLLVLAGMLFVLLPMLLLLATLMFSEMTPWALASRSTWPTFREQWGDLVKLFELSRLLFAHRETASVVGGFVTVYAGLGVLERMQPAQSLPNLLSVLTRNAGRLRVDLQAGTYLTVGIVLLGVLLGVMKPFAQHVYPNVLVTYGGGQPAVVEIQPTTSGNAPETPFAGIQLIHEAGAPVVTEQVVVWHESDRFLYVAPLRRAPAAPGIVAIDLRAVRSMRQIDTSVHVGSNGHLLVIDE